jgi:predicted SprT family Zn-dependent metalloprotease
VAAAKRPPSTLTGPALKLIVRSYLRRLGEEHRTRQVQVTFNPRLRTAIGRAEPSRRRIYLNPWLLDRYPRELVPTVVHELCHVVAGLREGHGPRWKKLMDRCGLPAEVVHDLDTSDLEIRRRTWRWNCVNCGEDYRRKSRAAKYYRCGQCAGRLVVAGAAPNASPKRAKRRRNDAFRK